MRALTVSDTIDLLRGRFHRCRYARSEQDYNIIAQDMGLTKVTLYRFAKGGAAHEDTLAKIEGWCEREEQAHATAQR